MRRTEYLPEGAAPLFPDNQPLSALQLAMEDQTILTGMAIRCDAQRDLTVRFGGYEGTIPRLDAIHPSISGAERDIAILSRVGKPTSFTITAIDTDGGGRPRLTLSRRAAQEQSMAWLLENAPPGAVLPARVTHLEKFGAFVDLGCGVTSLIPLENISVARIPHPGVRFRVDQDILAAVTLTPKTAGSISATRSCWAPGWRTPPPSPPGTRWRAWSGACGSTACSSSWPPTSPVWRTGGGIWSPGTG